MIYRDSAGNWHLVNVVHAAVPDDLSQDFIVHNCNDCNYSVVINSDIIIYKIFRNKERMERLLEEITSKL